MEAAVRTFFERYERYFNQAIDGESDLQDVRSMYAPEFIAASPHGVMTGKNDDGLTSIMRQGYEHYRSIGTKHMRVQNVRITSIDELHCLAQVRWKSDFVRKDRSDVTIEFDVHYLVQCLEGQPKVFGWVTGDEQALLREHGVG